VFGTVFASASFVPKTGGENSMKSASRAATDDRRKLLKQRQLERVKNSGLAHIVERNIEAIDQYRREAEEARSFRDRLADLVTRFSGSIPFIYFHMAWFGIWVLLNLEIGGFPAFDPFPFGLLTTIVSLEAIFLSTFVLVSQNRQAAIAERRAELDLQFDLLAEYEVTRILKLIDAMAKKMNLGEPDQAEIKELKKDVKPEAVLQELDAKVDENNHRPKKPKKSKRRKAST
jgi:uncharacterized membrane protein